MSGVFGKESFPTSTVIVNTLKIGSHLQHEEV